MIIYDKTHIILADELHMYQNDIPNYFPVRICWSWSHVWTGATFLQAVVATETMTEYKLHLNELGRKKNGFH